MHINSFCNHDDNKLVSATNLINFVQFICIMEYELLAMKLYANQMSRDPMIREMSTTNIWKDEKIR